MLEKILNTEHKENARKTLVISPHADDEVLGCGAYIDKETSTGNIVDVLIMAVGPYVAYSGKETPSEEKLEEVKLCHHKLGVRKSMVFCPAESRLDTIPQNEIVSMLDQILKEGYDTVFIPYPSRHADHQVTFNCAMASLRLKEGKQPESEVYLYEYPFVHNFDNIQGGAVYLPMTINDLNRKIANFQIYKSQVKKSPSPLNATGISTLAQMRGMEAGLRFAEKYYLQTKILWK